MGFLKLVAAKGAQAILGEAYDSYLLCLDAVHLLELKVFNSYAAAEREHLSIAFLQPMRKHLT